MEKKPVIVYGASGYTGRLIMEYLRDAGIPFVAAGRSASKLETAIKAVPGIETAEYEIAEVGNDKTSLAKLFSGAKVICNTVGPFYRHGDPVAQAAVEAGCHYIDTTGEQGWIVSAVQKYADAFAKAGRLFAPATSYMYTTGDIAAQLARKLAPGADSIDVLTYLNATPTHASTQSIFDLLRSPAYYLENSALVEWPAGAAFETVSPGGHQTVLAAPWGGGAQPIWYKSDPLIRNARLLVGWPNRGLVQGVIDIGKALLAEAEGKSEKEKIALLTAKAEQIQSGMPPRENPLVNRTCDSAIVRGTGEAAQVALFGTCAYKQTGVLQATAVKMLLTGECRRTGFASPCQAFGHDVLLAALMGYGLVKPKTIFA